MADKLPPDQYYEQLAKVPTSGGALIRNTKGEFLLVKHPYKDGWHIPGGMTEKNESPRQAVLRELQEELGITTDFARAFCVDFAKDGSFHRILFVFDCGVISEDTIKKIHLDKDEILEFRFMAEKELLTSLSPRIGRRIANSIAYLHSNGCVYLEDGLPIDNNSLK